MSGSDSKYFQQTKSKGEIHELKEELAAQSKDKKKEAVKKVIAAMTVGKDVSMLFADVVNCMQTPMIDLKKLVYLYLINYAKSQPDLAILAVNTFVKDSQDPNPLVRALAVRTMGCIRVDKITEYLCEPLGKCLKDEDPYVRKTATVCVAKLFDINAELVEDKGFLDSLKDMLSDSNPMVVANAVAALSEVNEALDRNVFKITSGNLHKLLAALNECTEWGQVFILDALINYNPSGASEAESIIERVTPRLQHANAAVVLSAVKVVMKLLSILEEENSSPDLIKQLTRKMAPPLVTLLSSEPEVQYVALRNISLIVQRRPAILANDIKVFFCKYNDPVYVKMEKLEIMIRLCSDKNIEQVLLELKEYATEVDIDFVRKAVRAIGRCAIKLQRAAGHCINVLLELIQTKVNYVVQEAIVVIKDIFRKYPNRYEKIIATLCENLDTLDEPEAKASMIWIIGEYAERIDNADEILGFFLENFTDETSQVQLQLVTATVKLFLKRPSDTQEMVQKVLSLSTQESDNPDLRDRGYVYWRLLSTDPEAAKTVVLAEKPVITDDTDLLEPSALDELLENLSTLSSVYHKPPETFVSKTRAAVPTASSLSSRRDDDDDNLRRVDDDDRRGNGRRSPSPERERSRKEKSSPAPPPKEDNLLDLDDPVPTNPAPAAGGNDIMSQLGSLGIGGGGGNTVAPVVNASDFFGGAAPAPAAAPVRRNIVLPAARGKGLQIHAAFIRRNGQIAVDFLFENQSQQPLRNFAIVFNKNSFGLAPASALVVPQPLMPGDKAEVTLPMVTNGVRQTPGNQYNMVQIAVRCNLGDSYFGDLVPLHVVCGEDGRLERQRFLEMWKGIADEQERQKVIQGLPDHTPEQVQALLEASNLFLIARRQNDQQQDVMYFSCKTSNDVVLLLEITLRVQPGAVKLATKTTTPEIAPLAEDSVAQLLKQ